MIVLVEKNVLLVRYWIIKNSGVVKTWHKSPGSQQSNILFGWSFQNIPRIVRPTYGQNFQSKLCHLIFSLYGWVTLHQLGLLSRATASDSFRNNIGLSKLSPDSILYRKVAERWGILSSIWFFGKYPKIQYSCHSKAHQGKPNLDFR
jgi:hypothetical protein